MPKREIDYSTRMIYFYKFVKIDDPNFLDCYVGHTINIINRKYCHKYVCNNPNDRHYNSKIYKTIRDNGGWENWKMLVIHQQICKDIIQARQIEQKFIEELNAKMNMRGAYISEQLKENAKEKQKEYYENNKEKINEQQKEYYEKNKQTKLKYRKDHYENNKERIKEKYKEEITCECGSIYCRYNKSQHERSIKHQKFLQNNSTIEPSTQLVIAATNP
jgi:predicted RNA-binding protein YlxR (DUF448 family)